MVFKEILEGVLKQHMINESFRRGQMGEPPISTISGNEEVQRIYDKAYNDGRRSLLNKLASKWTRDEDD